MPVRFRILGSGSAGNAALLQTDDTRVLVDAGFSARRLQELLAAAGESLARIDAIFLTHEHGDHAAGLSGLARHPHIRVFANAGTAQVLQRSLRHRVSWQHFETGSSFRFRDLEVSSFAVPHDAQDPVGFVIAHGHEGDLFAPRRALAWLTDLGHAPAHIVQRLRDVDVLVVEANYCPRLLEADPKRPWSVKQRINGRHGHLSNDAVRDLLAAIPNPRLRHVFFAHLSRDCNTPDAVATACAPVLTALRCTYAVVPPGEGSTPYEF